MYDCVSAILMIFKCYIRTAHGPFYHCEEPNDGNIVMLSCTTLPPRTFGPGFYNIQRKLLTNDHLALLGEVVCGHLEVEWRRALSYAARDIVVGSMARAEPAAKIASLADGDTSKMGADAWQSLAD